MMTHPHRNDSSSAQMSRGARSSRSSHTPNRRRTSALASVLRVVPALLIGMFVMLSATDADALTREELITLKKQKVPDSVVINLVRTSVPINLSKADLAELRKLGAGDALIKFLENNGHVLVDATPDGGGPGDPAPAENDPDAMAAEEARRKAEEEARIRAEAEKLRKADQEREARAADIKRQASKITEAESALSNNNNMGAAKTCLAFLTLDPSPESEEYYRAKFCLARALFKEKVYSGAAGPLIDVLMQGPEKKYFKAAFEMLRVLTKENGYAPPQLEELTKFYVENLDQKFQDEYHYYLGKFFYDYRKLDLAFKYLDKVSEDSKFKPKALYLTGVAQIDPEVKKYRSAVQSFQNAILAAEREKTADDEVRELGYLALARVAYEATNYDGALYYYNKINPLSPRRATALFESSWTYFLKNDQKRAIGTFHTLHSPYYAQWYYPDLYVLEATVYLNMCKFGNAREALSAFNQRYLDKQPILQKFLETTLKPEDYYSAVADAYAKKGKTTEGEKAGLPMIFVQAILNNAVFFNGHRVIQNLTREEAALKANIEKLGEFGQEVLGRVESARKNKLLEAGIQIQQLLTQTDSELDDWSVKADKVSFEIDKARADELKTRLQNPDYKPPTATEGTTLFVVADDWQYWPFEGEYWIDEVTNYRSFLRTECVKQ